MRPGEFQSGLLADIDSVMGIALPIGEQIFESGSGILGQAFRRIDFAGLTGSRDQRHQETVGLLVCFLLERLKNRLVRFPACTNN